MLTRSDLSLIAVRVVALYLIANGITSAPYLYMVWNSEMYEEFGNRWWLTVAGSSSITMGLLLFFLSRPFARLVMPTGVQAEEPPANLSGIQSVAISTIGLFVIVLSLPDLLVGLATFSPASGRATGEALRWYEDLQILAALVRVVLGVVLCTGPSYWARQLKKFRDLGYAKSSD